MTAFLAPATIGSGAYLAPDVPTNQTVTAGTITYAATKVPLTRVVKFEGGRRVVVFS